MTAYYNEFDKNAAAWLRELIKEGVIALGDVDERSIIEVPARDLKGYTQHHFFAGIGGWSYALRLAGWPDDAPVWTASLPCQPFSTAGKQLGKQDERHLLPHFLELVKECRPHRIFGEQVDRAIGHGWLDDLQATMEAEGYAIGHCVLGAHSIGAAHIRQRLYWVANSIGDSNKQEVGRINGEAHSIEIGDGQNLNQSGQSCGAGANVCRMANTKNKRREPIENEQPARIFSASNGEKECIMRSSELCATSGINWIYCRDNKYRPIESGLKPLVDGVPRGMVHSSDPRNTQEARAMRLKGYGNAIVPQLAAEFINVFMGYE